MKPPAEKKKPEIKKKEKETPQGILPLSSELADLPIARRKPQTEASPEPLITLDVPKEVTPHAPETDPEQIGDPNAEETRSAGVEAAPEAGEAAEDAVGKGGTGGLGGGGEGTGLGSGKGPGWGPGEGGGVGGGKNDGGKGTIQVDFVKARFLGENPVLTKAAVDAGIFNAVVKLQFDLDEIGEIASEITVIQSQPYGLVEAAIAAAQNSQREDRWVSPWEPARITKDVWITKNGERKRMANKGPFRSTIIWIVKFTRSQ